MAIPALPPFEGFLSEVRVSTEQPVAGPWELLSESPAFGDGRGAKLWLAYPNGELQLDSVLRKIAQALEAAGSPSSRQVTLAVLALIAETKGAGRLVEHANELLAELRQVDLLVNFVSPGPSATVDIRTDLGPMRVEPFDPTTLEYWARRGGAKWPINLKSVRSHVVFVGKLPSITLINPDSLPGVKRLVKNWSDRATRIVDPYYQAVADTLLLRLKEEVEERLSLSDAAGLTAFDFSSVDKWSWGIHLFTWPTSNLSRAGCWAIYSMPGLVLNIPSREVWERARQWLLSEFGLETFSGRDRPIDVAARTFAGLMQDARAHQGDGREREAFLYFVIALDHLLGEAGKSTSTVADRTGVVTHRLRSKAFMEEVACVRRVYDARSRLVHRGDRVTMDDLRDAEALARCVLWAITRVVAEGEFETLDEWVDKIDSVAHLLRGDPGVVTDDRLAAVGAVEKFLAGPPPPMLGDRGSPNMG